MAVVAPMPSASAAMPVAVKAGLRRSWRMPQRTSCQRPARTSSLDCRPNGVCTALTSHPRPQPGAGNPRSRCVGFFLSAGFGGSHGERLSCRELFLSPVRIRQRYVINRDGIRPPRFLHRKIPPTRPPPLFRVHHQTSSYLKCISSNLSLGFSGAPRKPVPKRCGQRRPATATQPVAAPS